MNLKLLLLRLAWGAGVLAALTLAACSLAEDLTPPPGIELTQAASIPTPAFAAFKPSPILGEFVYSQHCVKCHGATGKGDGEMAPQLAAQRPEPLPDFSNPDILHGESPQKLYLTITAGRIDKFMPPFADTLTTADRWNVIAYLYSLSQPLELATQGEAVFTAQCATCHGASGQGGSAPQNLGAPDFFSAQSEADLAAALKTDAHASVSALSDGDRTSVSVYVRSLAYDLSHPAAAAPTPTISAATPVAATTLDATSVATTTVIAPPTEIAPTAAPVAAGVTVSGTITNGSGSGAIPADLLVNLFVFDDQFQQHNTYTTTVQGGRYEFANLLLLPKQVVFVVVKYAGLSYNTDIATYTGAEANFDLPLQIYDVAHDPSVLRILRWHLIFSVPTAGKVQVTELLIFSNASDKVYIPANASDPALSVALPTGAVNLQFPNAATSDQYQTTGNGFSYSGGIRPGEGSFNVAFSYELPLSGAQKYNWPSRYAVDTVNVLIPTQGLTIAAPDLTGPTTQQMQSVTYLMYAGAQWPADKPLTLTLTSPNAAAPTNSPLLFIGLMLLVVGGVGGVAWWWRTRKPVTAQTPADLEQRRAALIEELAQLDEGFEKGEYDAGDYQRLRAALKAEALSIARQLEER
jgi:mono/diheme cytochrome c family protein